VRGGGLYRVEATGQVGPRQHTRTVRAQGRTPSPTRARREVGDDRHPPWQPPRRAEPALGRQPDWAAKRRERRRTGDGVEGPPPDFGSWAAQGNKKKGKEGFSIFKTKDSNKIQTQV
jgi:hypothetical protein